MPLLRTTIRRAIAEVSPSASMFEPPGFFDRLLIQASESAI
jgi:hypothetical protein